MSRAGAPQLIVIPDPRFARRATLEALAAAALAGGADAIQLRAKALPDEEVVAIGRRLAAACRARGALFFVIDDAAAALACGADGVHVGPGDSAPGEARRLLGPRRLIGVSLYEPADIAAAEAARAAYVAVGGVFPTAMKKIATVGLEGVRRLRAATRLPIVAIGGITAENAAAAIEAGADGVAVSAAVSAAPDPEAATRELRAVVVAAPRRASGLSSPTPSTGSGRTWVIPLRLLRLCEVCPPIPPPPWHRGIEGDLRNLYCHSTPSGGYFRRRTSRGGDGCSSRQI